MGKFYYVYMLNQTDYYNENEKYQKTKTGELLRNIAGNRALDEYGSYALAIYGVKWSLKNVCNNNLFGQSSSRYYDPDPLFMICEDMGNCLSEVITGNIYESVNDNNCINLYSEKLKLKKVKEVPPTKVAEILKNLSNGEIERFCKGINKLNSAISIGYHKDMAKQKSDAIKEQSDIVFIKDFKNRQR